MSPFSEANGLDSFGERGKVVPSITGGLDDIVHVFENGVGQPAGAEELPDISTGFSAEARDGSLIGLMTVL